MFFLMSATEPSTVWPGGLGHLGEVDEREEGALRLALGEVPRGECARRLVGHAARRRWR